MGLSLSHLLLILVAALFVFGARRLPSIMGDLAKGLKAFKAGLHGDEKPPRLTKTPKIEKD